MRHALKLSWERHEQARTCHADRPAYSKNGAWIDCSHGLEHRHNVPHASSAEGSAYRADSDPGVHDTPSPPFLSTAFFWEKLTVKSHQRETVQGRQPALRSRPASCLPRTRSLFGG